MMLLVDTKVEVQYNDGGVRYGENSLWSILEGTPGGSGKTGYGERPEHTGSRKKIIDPHIDGTDLGK